MGNCFGNDSGPDDNGRNVDPVRNNNNLIKIPFKIESIDPFLVDYLRLPLQEERRRQAAEAAEKRQREAEGKGIKDPEAYKRKLEQREKMEREAERAGGGDAPLKVNPNNCQQDGQTNFKIIPIKSNNVIYFYMHVYFSFQWNVS